jgi:hypothetical protein
MRDDARQRTGCARAEGWEHLAELGLALEELLRRGRATAPPGGCAAALVRQSCLALSALQRQSPGAAPPGVTCPGFMW